MKVMEVFLPIVLVGAIVGCDTTDQGTVTVTPAGGNGEHAHDHDHPHPHGHDHGSLVDRTVAGHAHGVGPHGGTVVDWGGGTYHVELTIDPERQQAVAYVLGGDEKTPVPIDAGSIELAIQSPQMQLTLEPEPSPKDPTGKSSRYSGTEDSLSTLETYAGTITGVVEGTPYSGDFDASAQDVHEH
ncbi:MAG: hypothetical protein AAGD07_24385 [Planctomycetota bacterium]